MSTNPESTSKKARRDAARAQRVEAEQAAASADQRKRRLTILGGLVAVAAVIVVVAVIVSSGGKSGTKTPKIQAGETVAGQKLSEALLNGIPQSGLTLGSPTAKVTVLEFADLQCPVCKEFSQQVLPQVVQDYVRNGKAKIELHLVNILDRGGITDSAKMAAFAYGAQQQDKLWNFADIQYWNQPEEDTGYATPTYIKHIASGVTGLDVAKATTVSATSAATDALKTNTALFTRYGAEGTPTIVVGPTGGTLKTLANFDQGTVEDAIKAALPSGT